MIKKDSNLVFYFNFIAFSQFIIINKKNCNLIHKRFKILITSTIVVQNLTTSINYTIYPRKQIANSKIKYSYL